MGDAVKCKRLLLPESRNEREGKMTTFSFQRRTVAFSLLPTRCHGWVWVCDAVAGAALSPKGLRGKIAQFIQFGVSL